MIIPQDRQAYQNAISAISYDIYSENVRYKIFRPMELSLGYI